MTAIAEQVLRHPMSNKQVAVEDVDGLLEMLHTLKEEKDRLQIFENEVRRGIEYHTDGDAKTRHVQGSKFKATVTMPNDYWDRTKLRKLYDEYSNTGYAKQYIRINETYAPNMTQVNALDRTVGAPAFEEFKEKLLAARKPATAAAKVTLEPIQK